MSMGAFHQPLSVALGRQVIPVIDAGDSVEDPGGGHILRGPQIAKPILVDRTAPLGDGACKPQSLTTLPVRTLSSAASTMRRELMASSTCEDMSRLFTIASRKSRCSRLHSS